MNEKLIESFLEDSKARGISKKRIDKYKTELKNICRLLDKDFRKVRLQDIKKLVIKINENNWADATKYDHQVIFKIFWRWFKKDDNPEEIKWLKPKNKNGRSKLPEELLTQEEVKTLINATPNIKYKLIVCLLYESGARISEILDLRLKHITFEKDKPIAKILVNGKTGMRRILLYATLPYLRKYLNESHIDKDNPEAFLFYPGKNPLRRIAYNTVRIRIRWLKHRTDIKKAVNPHIFRHSRASYLANFLTEAQMKQYFGWTQGSDMCQIYIHMSGRDIDDALLSKVYGLKEVKEEVEQDKTIKPKICFGCGLENAAEYKFCEKCNLPLNINDLVKKDQEKLESEKEIKRFIEIVKETLPEEEFIRIMQKVV